MNLGTFSASQVVEANDSINGDAVSSPMLGRFRELPLVLRFSHSIFRINPSWGTHSMRRSRSPREASDGMTDGDTALAMLASCSGSGTLSDWLEENDSLAPAHGASAGGACVGGSSSAGMGGGAVGTDATAPGKGSPFGR
eukprot:CAMPEP_0168392820 /NCGR_PEP_ID=MMETSP0228-20121227/18694_1 /TAXON_ID=133427 /ORGANISM="Protoceratium reticulatum, Strain CCCM 535 (=CCMP 1889)" /LENGTH=139 /DNA_ID=CAMNT_0008406171 /DNA_START=1571 /DNA_END=1987 /DNA_ORIENTATION=+